MMLLFFLFFLCCFFFFFFFFFFQAEDGIRDDLVTGVQTVLFRSPEREPAPAQVIGDPRERVQRIAHRSEERRVGKECRSRWAAYHLKKKKRYKKRGDY